MTPEEILNIDMQAADISKKIVDVYCKDIKREDKEKVRTISFISAVKGIKVGMNATNTGGSESDSRQHK